VKIEVPPLDVFDGLDVLDLHEELPGARLDLWPSPGRSSSPETHPIMAQALVVVVRWMDDG